MDHRLAHVIRVMEEDLDGRHSIAALAASVNLSPSRLAVLFRRETGVTPARYLRALRMERARVLLERSFLSVKEVMAFVGVNDPSHFSRDFRRHHGVPPSRLRTRSWAADYGVPHAIGQDTDQTAHVPPPQGAGAAAIVGSGEKEETTTTSNGRHRDGQGEDEP